MVRNNITIMFNIVFRKKLVEKEEKAIEEVVNLYHRAKIYGMKHCVVYYYDFEEKDPSKHYENEELKKGEMRAKDITNPEILALIGFLVHQYLGDPLETIEAVFELTVPIRHILNVNKLMKTKNCYVSSRQIIKNYLEQ